MNARLVLLAVATASIAGAAAPARQRVFEAYGKLPLSFERNHGQAPPDAAFVAVAAATQCCY